MSMLRLLCMAGNTKHGQVCAFVFILQTIAMVDMQKSGIILAERLLARFTLKDCVHSDPDIKAEARLRKLRNSIGEMVDPVPVLSWHCVWCGQHYQGEKFCSVCGTGIDSIEGKV